MRKSLISQMLDEQIGTKKLKIDESHSAGLDISLMIYSDRHEVSIKAVVASISLICPLPSLEKILQLQSQFMQALTDLDIASQKAKQENL